MPLNRRKTRMNLVKKGFLEDRRGDHITLTYPADSRLSKIQTKMSHGSKRKDIHDGLVSSMARQCMISTSDFIKLAQCEISESDYVKLLRSHLPKD